MMTSINNFVYHFLLFIIKRISYCDIFGSLQRAKKLFLSIECRLFVTDTFVSILCIRFHICHTSISLIHLYIRTIISISFSIVMILNYFQFERYYQGQLSTQEEHYYFPLIVVIACIVTV